MKKLSKGKVIFYSLAIPFILYVYSGNIVDFIGKIVYKDYVMEELTMEQKVEDFEILFENIVSSVPYLDEIEEVYGIDFVERKEYYLEAIRNTESNFEFYCVMKAILKDIPSFHTDLSFPFYANLELMNCYGSEEALGQMGCEYKINEWTKEIERNVLIYDDIDMINAMYIDGEYIVDDAELAEEYEGLKDSELISIDGVAAEEYVLENISTYKLSYDGKNNKPYRLLCTFNNTRGKKVHVVWQDSKGDFIEQDLYLDLGAEIAMNYGWIFSDKYTNDKWGAPSVSMHRDEVNNLEYINIEDFSNADGDELREYLENTPCDKIVIDMRSNSGGQKSYGQKYLYPALYSEDVSFSTTWTVPNTEANEVMTKDFWARWDYLSSKDEEFSYYEDVKKYRGSATREKKIYYLMGRATGSAADSFLQMIKQNDLGTIVGGNSAGEGLGNSYICHRLKNSALLYTYYPALTLTEEGVCSSVWGTTPDVYINQTREDYILEKQYQQDGVADQYEKRLEYDTVLKWVVEQ